MYDSSNTMVTTLITPIKEDVFSLDNIESDTNNIANGKAKDIGGCQAQILKIGISILIPYLHKLLNLVVTHGFPRLWMKTLIVPIFKNGDKSVPSYYHKISLDWLLIRKLYVTVSKHLLTEA